MTATPLPQQPPIEKQLGLNKEQSHTLALRITLHPGPIHTTKMNFSLLLSLSLAYWTRQYANEALLSSSWSRSSSSPPVPVEVRVSLSERSLYGCNTFVGYGDGRSGMCGCGGGSEDSRKLGKLPGWGRMQSGEVEYKDI